MPGCAYPPRPLEVSQFHAKWTAVPQNFAETGTFDPHYFVPVVAEPLGRSEDRFETTAKSTLRMRNQNTLRGDAGLSHHVSWPCPNRFGD